jgi:CHAT domain-containing protein/Tfp pilus assembly protein PilF
MPRGLVLAVVLAVSAGAEPPPSGVVVEDVQEGFAGHQAGLEPGDVLSSWEREAALPAGAPTAQGVLRSPFDVLYVEVTEAPRGAVTLIGMRNGERWRWRVPSDPWRLTTHPAPDRAGDGTAWASYRAALAAAAEKRWEAAEAALAETRRTLAGARDAPAPTLAALGVGRALAQHDAVDLAARVFRGALEDERTRASPTLVEAQLLAELSTLDRERDVAAAEAEARQSLALYENLAPGSLQVAARLRDLGNGRRLANDLAGAEEFLLRALTRGENAAPRSQTVALILQELGHVAATRGNLVGADFYYRQTLALRESLAANSVNVAVALTNLGGLAWRRGDLTAAEEYHRRALAIRERLSPGSKRVAVSLYNLGRVAAARGDLGPAEECQRRAIAIAEKASWGAPVVSYYELGEIERRRGHLGEAREALDRALALAERAPNGGASAMAADVRLSLGDVALAAGDLERAEAEYRRSLDIRRALCPGSAGEAEAFARLAVLEERKNDRKRALDLYGQALDALDAQRRTFGGSDEAKTRFSARYAEYYRDTIDLLMQDGRSAEAFHVLERYRARALLAMLAERDIVFSADLPADLDRERRIANAEYDRALASVGDTPEPQAAEATAALARARRRQREIEDRVRAASPRLAALQYPDPLDLAAARRVLDPETLLLSYSIGEQHSYLFAVGPGPDDFLAVPLDTDLTRLRRDVRALRELLQEGQQLRAKTLELVSRQLSALLLAPAADRIARARRVLIAPDGPLHLIPFAALADPAASGRVRPLVEARPVSVVASATTFAEIRRNRRPRVGTRLVAFGDPDYPPCDSDSAAAAPPPWRGFVRGALPPLPASRREVLDLAQLFGAPSQAYVGADATEERAKSAAKEASLLHFACHGIADEDSPLDSALALSFPKPWEPGRDNGLLQAWEIFEQVRLDADLVTLSACGTALGQEMSGEGIVGLTRAFQYAGAPSVLASLWGVNDESTARLMQRFYASLRKGMAKDAALREAQLAMMRRPASSHPYHWAAFQLIGDWH